MVARSLAAVGLLTVVLSSCGGGGASSTSGSTTRTASPAGTTWRQHADPQAGFTIDYPDSWNVYQRTDPGVQFLAGPNEHDFVEVRVVSNLPVSFAPTDTQLMKKLVDDLLSKQAINIISATQVTESGLVGWQYIYSFQDPTLGTGVHIHVFLFQGNRLHTLVFQALPNKDLSPLAPAFDQILVRYHALAPQPPSTPAAPASPTEASSPTP